VVCGHIHEASGRSRLGETEVINASLVDARYRPVNPPVVLELGL
jgi:Icc-related predicted phosphoesterase